MNPKLDPLLDWYQSCRRSLPWRDQSTPYRVWVSEVMLQQTTSAAVIPYFLRWMERFPSLESLAAADESQVLELWQGLGYYSRARNLLAGAKVAAAQGIPSCFEEWLKMPGVGRYTAAAISSISQGQPEALVDGNVERVYSRLCKDDSPRSRLKVRAWDWAKDELRQENPGDWNQALMELGSQICTPANPKCEACPLNDACQAHLEGSPEKYPVPAPKREFIPVEQEAVVLIHRESRSVGLIQFGPDQWWHGLFGFPSPIECQDLSPIEIGKVSQTVTCHKLTVRVSASAAESKYNGLSWVGLDQMDRTALPSAHRKIWKLFLKEQHRLPNSVQL